MTKEAPQKTIHLMAGVFRNPHLWVVAIMVVLIVVIHYHETFSEVHVVRWIGSVLGFGLTRHTLERILFLIPVAYGAALLGTGGGISILVLAAAAMFPRAFFISPEPREALFETGGVIFTGALLVALFDVLQKGRQRLTELETAHKILNLQVKKLSMLHVFSSRISQSLELTQVLNAIRGNVGQVMDTESTWLYLWDEEKKRLKLAASVGLSEGAPAETLKLGESLDGMVAESKQSKTIEDTSADPKLKTALLSLGSLRSVLIVPLILKGMLVGTLGVGTRSVHHFAADEVDLLGATGDQVTMAVERARLYEKERLIAERLLVSEKNYRELFENASEAIWVHDLSGIILAANGALERLAGYKRDDLIGAQVSMLLPSHEMTRMSKRMHDKVLRGEHTEAIEQELVKKDGSTVIVHMGTSLIKKDGVPWAFQHIARDITEEKRIQENLRLYVQQVTQAQEAERKRIARELHDETAQALVAVSRNLDDLASGNSPVSIQDVREKVRGILLGVRQFSQQLRPSILDDLGLLPAVQWLASDLTKNYNISAEVEVVGNQRKLPSEVELMLFRIIQEALTNVRRHSAATKVCIKVELTGSSTKVTMSDDGKGFEVPERAGDLARTGKLGLAGMEERAQLLGGNLTIDSKPGKGTILTVEVPL